MNDNGNIRLAIVVLGILALTCLVGGVVVVLSDRSLPDAFIAIGASAATAITLVISRPMGGTQDVRVIDEPLQVTETPAATPKKRTPKR